MGKRLVHHLDIGSPGADVATVCGDVPLLSGTMGRKEDKIVIKVKGKAEKNA